MALAKKASYSKKDDRWETPRNLLELIEHLSHEEFLFCFYHWP